MDTNVDCLECGEPLEIGELTELTKGDSVACDGCGHVFNVVAVDLDECTVQLVDADDEGEDLDDGDDSCDGDEDEDDEDDGDDFDDDYDDEDEE